jgi:hypothetical protein
MPMKSRKAGKNISEFHTGSRYRDAVKKYGKKHADKIAIAAGMSAAAKARKKK